MVNSKVSKADALRIYKDAFHVIVFWWEPHGSGVNFLTPVERQAIPEYWPAIQQMAELARLYPDLPSNADLDIRRVMNTHNFHISLYSAVMDDIRILATTPFGQQTCSELEAVCA